MPSNTKNEAKNTETLVYFISCIFVIKSVYCNLNTMLPVVVPFSDVLVLSCKQYMLC